MIGESTDKIVEFGGVGKSFGRKTALVDVTCEIPKGCACGLVGPNEAGKTTLIKLLLNIPQPTRRSPRNTF